MAQKSGGTLKYIHQDHLGGTAAVSSDNGTLLDAISYYPYGSTRTGDVPTDRKFTGQREDGTGLYYYEARYYDPEIGRFISPDTVQPDRTNPQTLNRYTYVLNNPLHYIDPTGHWPRLKNIGKFLAKHIDTIQTALDVAGMILGVGEAFDAVNGVIYAARGDALNAGLSFSAMIPVVGNIATGAKLTSKAIKGVKNVARAAGKTKNAIDSVAGVAKRVHGNTAGDQMATLYAKVDRNGNLKKWGVTQNTAKRYSKSKLGTDRLRVITRGPRRKMLDLERKMVETSPGPQNHEPWAGAAWK